jgi:hypothetical protein
VCGQYHIHITTTSDTDINVVFEKLRKDLETSSNYEGTSFSSKITGVEDLTVQGKVGKKYYAEPGFPHYNGGLLIINNGKLYQVTYLDMSKEKDGCPDLDYKGIFDRMVSTFRFVNLNAVDTQKQCQANSIPEIVDLTYDDARVKITAVGWKSVQTHSSISNFPSGTGNITTFWNKGYKELQDCAGTGLGQCLFLFQDSCGNYLHVSTVGEEGAGYHATVQAFSVNQSKEGF